MASIGLVLSGGMAKGAYQIGVLQALNEFIGDGNTVYISAASIGGLNAYAYATNKLNDAKDMWLNHNLGGIRSLLKIFARTPYVFDTIDGFNKENAKIQAGSLYVTCFNTKKRALNYIDLCKLKPSIVKDFLKASVAMPVFSKAVEISGTKYLDGALIDNIPIFPLMKHHLDYIIVIHFDKNTYKFENDYFDNKLIKINFIDDRIIKNSLSFDQSSVSVMINSGYEQSKAIFEIIFKNGSDDFDYIYQKMAFLNAMQKDKQLRITGDIVVNNINKVLKRITKERN